MLNLEQIKEFAVDELLNAAVEAYELIPPDKAATIIYLKIRAQELGIAADFDEYIKSLDDLNKNKASNEASSPCDGVLLRRAANGRVLQTIENFHNAMASDPYYAKIRLNVLTQRIEIEKDGKSVEWNDAENSRSKEYMSIVYDLRRADCHQDALNILGNERLFNPLADMLNAIEWDGKKRMEQALIDIMHCDDNEYSKEVSRLIFSGGVARAFNPGCKFDEVPILIGEKQGEGKSTFIRWLAMKDDYFTDSVSNFDGKDSIESIRGKWIVEIGEMLAMKRAKEVEAVKAYLSRQVDYYRAPYERYANNYPRFCIFIGSSNDLEILGDRTGNRRFYPILVHSSAYELYARKEEIQEYIKQCWAEAVELWRKGELTLYAKKERLNMIHAAQEDAVEDDPRLGLIEKYLKNKPVGAEICSYDLWYDALNNNPDLRQPDAKKDLLPLRNLMRKFPEWERCQQRVQTAKYGQQRIWRKRILWSNRFIDTEAMPFDD